MKIKRIIRGMLSAKNDFLMQKMKKFKIKEIKDEF